MSDRSLDCEVDRGAHRLRSITFPARNDPHMRTHLLVASATVLPLPSIAGMLALL